MVGCSYEAGTGVEKNIQEAVCYYQKASDEKYPPALAELAGCYLLGKGVRRNLEKSFALMKQACDEGDEQALLMIAKYYFNGWGTKEDKGEALRIMNSLKESLMAKMRRDMPPSLRKGTR